MFSLIITVISIALVAVLAIASIYYGGSAMTTGTAKANAATLVNHGQQLNGANAMYKNDNGGSNAISVADLVSDNYLSSAPAAPSSVVYADSTGLISTWDINTTDDVFSVQINSLETCGQVQRQAVNDDAVDTAFSEVSSQPFGCYGSAAPYTVFYKR